MPLRCFQYAVQNPAEFPLLPLQDGIRIYTCLLYTSIEFIERMREPYVIIAPSYMVYAANYSELLQAHIDSDADITLLYHSVDNAREAFLNCDILNLNKQKGVESIEKNRGSAQKRNIFMDTYIMKKELFIELIKKGKKISSMYTLSLIHILLWSA